MSGSPAESRRFFLSYSRHNRDWAEWIAWELEATGHKADLQHWDSVPGTHYMQWIEKAISDADHVVVLLSDAYLRSAFGQTEFRMAYQIDPDTAHRRVIPVRVELCETPPGSLIAQLTYFDLFGLAAEQARSALLTNIDDAVRGTAHPATAPAFPGEHAAPGRLRGHYGGAPRFPSSRAPAAAGDIWPAVRTAVGNRVGVVASSLAGAFVALAAGLTATAGPGPHTTLLPVLLGLCCLYVVVLSASGNRTGAFSPDYAADDLEVAVRAQWAEQIRRLQLNRDALPVRWEAGPTELFDDWDALKRAAHGPGRPAPDTSTWAGSPAELAGTGNDLATTIDTVPTRRLVLLGDAGSGKTILLVRFVVDRLAVRRPGGEVPVLVSLSTWDPAQDLFAWLAERLLVAHPYLARRVGRSRMTMARALLDAGKILPVLDGLDEMPAHVRAGALAAINHALLPEHPLVLSSRITEYRATCLAMDARAGGTGLGAAAGVRLLPVEPAAVAAYVRTLDGSRQAVRWEALLASARANPDLPVAAALTAPLMVWLTRTAYAAGDRDTDSGGGREADLTELLDPVRFVDRAAVERHLLAQFVPAAYRGAENAAQAQQALLFLAQHLRDNRGGSPDLFWWEIPLAVPAAMVRALAGVMIGIFAGGMTGTLFAGWIAFFTTAANRTAVAAGIYTWLASGLATGVIWLVASYVGTSSPAQRLRWFPSPPRIPLMLLVGAGAGFFLTLAGGLGTGIVIGAVGAVFAGVQAAPVDPATPATPASVLARDRATFIALALIAGTTTGATAGLALGLAPDAELGLRLAVGIPAGFLVGMAAGLGAGTLGAVWGWFTIARTWLAFDRQLPRHLFSFLDDAYERGVLRQVGVAYQFRHIDIQHHLAPPGRAGPPRAGGR